MDVLMVRFLAVLAVLVLSACGAGAVAPEPETPPDFVTPCGLEFYGVDVSASEAASVEASALGALSGFWADGCGLLAGVAVQVDAAKAVGGGGLFDADAQAIYLPDSGLRTGGVFIHELAHALDWNDRMGTDGLGHEGWQESGLVVTMNVWHAGQEEVQ